MTALAAQVRIMLLWGDGRRRGQHTAPVDRLACWGSRGFLAADLEGPNDKPPGWEPVVTSGRWHFGGRSPS